MSLYWPTATNWNQILKFLDGGTVGSPEHLLPIIQKHVAVLGKPSMIWYSKEGYIYSCFVIFYLLERQRERIPICCFTLQMPATTRTGPGQKPGARPQSRSVMRVAGPQSFVPALLLLKVCTSRKLGSGARARKGSQALWRGMWVSEQLG